MLYKLCRRCKKPITHPATYCGSCLPIIEDKRQQLLRERENRYNKKRDPKYKAFYNSSDWKLLKDKKMMDEEYRCERCRKLATEVHHIKPIQTREGKKTKLKQIVCDGTNLNLTKEKKVIEYGEVFEVDDECGAEILNATYKNKPVAELVEESAEKDKPSDIVVQNFNKLDTQ